MACVTRKPSEFESGSWRSEIRDGVEYHWVATTEHKTGKGKVEFLIPELTVSVLELMSRYVQPLQEQLMREIEELEHQSNPRDVTDRLLQIAKAKRNANKLFLCTSKSGQKESTNYHVDALTNGASNDAFRRLAKAAGTSWLLTPHQCRRTYARNIVESRMGRTSLVFLKWQFKHSSMSMTQLYASNPMQDASLFDEVLAEMTDFKVDLIESWLGDQPLSGVPDAPSNVYMPSPWKAGMPCWLRRQVTCISAPRVTAGVLPRKRAVAVPACTRRLGVSIARMPSLTPPLPTSGKVYISNNENYWPSTTPDRQSGNAPNATFNGHGRS